jgi:hypothetical protein
MFFDGEMTLALVKVCMCLFSPSRGRGHLRPDVGVAIGGSCPIVFALTWAWPFGVVALTWAWRLCPDVGVAVHVPQDYSGVRLAKSDAAFYAFAFEVACRSVADLFHTWAAWVTKVLPPSEE